MPSTTLKRRRTEEGMRGKTPKKRKNIKRQKFYHSSSEDEDDEGVARDAPRRSKPAKKDEVEQEEIPQEIEEKPSESKQKPQPKLKSALKTSAPVPQKNEEADSDEDSVEDASDAESSEDEDEDMDSEADSEASDISQASSLSETSTNNPARKVRKRNDPEAFATSISKILNTKLTTQKRSEPILARSKAADYTNKTLADVRLTQKAHRQVLAEKKAALEKGRVKDVLGLNDPTVSTEATTTKEKELRRTAQKGVIKLFNAVRAAQVKGEAAERESREKGVVGLAKREEQVKEMSKQGFLDMISGGATKKEGSVEA